MTRTDKLLLRVLTYLVGALATAFVSWATWVTVAVFDLQRELLVTKAANHLAVTAPELRARAREAPRLAYPGFESLITTPRKEKP